jgi:hypothetical protein
MEESLRQKYPKGEALHLLEPFQALADDHDFWNHTLDGLAVRGAPGMLRVYRLQPRMARECWYVTWGRPHSFRRIRGLDLMKWTHLSEKWGQDTIRQILYVKRRGGDWTRVGGEVAAAKFPLACLGSSRHRRSD